MGDLTARALAPLESLTEAARTRYAATLLAWLEHQSHVPAVVEALHVHPQTVRYRLVQLRDRFGPALDSPGARFELLLALRGRMGAS